MVEAHLNLATDEQLAQLRERQLRALERATVFLWTQIQLALNVPNTGQRVKRKGRRGSYTVYPNPSRPGEAPRKRTGFLQRNVKYDIDREKMVARVGLAANAKYGICLELGTSRMEARPFLIATARACAPQLAAIMKGAV